MVPATPPSLDSPTLGQRPTSLDGLLTDYGKYVGLEGLAFEEDNTLTLEIDQIILHLEFKNQATGILLMAQVGSAAEELDPAHLLTLNMLNLSTFGDGFGAVFFEIDTSGFFWMSTISVRGLTVELFHEAIEQALKSVRLWSKSIGSILSASAIETPHSHLEDSGIKV